MRLTEFRTFSSLRHRNFRYLCVSSLFYSTAEWVQTVTMGWLMYELTGSRFAVGALWAVRALPSPIVSPIAGVLTDRMSRRKLLIGNQIYVASIAVLLALLVASDRATATHLYLFAALNGAGTAFGTPLRQTLVANTVPPEDMQNAIGLNSTALTLMRIVGPAIGGVMIVLFGPGTNFLIQAGCDVGMGATVFLIRLEYRQGSKKAASPLADMREGFAYITGRRRLMGLVIIAYVPAIFMMPFSAGLLPVFSKDILKQDAGGLGMLLAMIGIGALIGTLAIATMKTKGASDVAQVAAGACGGLSLIVLSQMSVTGAAIPFCMGIGLGQMIFINLNNTVVQTITPDALRGRVLSIYSLFIGIGPAGGFLSGLTAQALGVTSAMAIGGGVTIGLVLLIALRFGLIGPQRREGAPAKSLA